MAQLKPQSVKHCAKFSNRLCESVSKLKQKADLAFVAKNFVLNCKKKLNGVDRNWFTEHIYQKSMIAKWRQ